MIRCAFLLIVAGGAAASASAETLESVEKVLTDKFQEYNALSAKLKMTMQMAPGMSGTATGTMEFLKHDGKEKARSEMEMKMDVGGQSMTSRVLNVFDGENAYSINEMMGHKQVMRTDPSQMTGRAGGAAFFADLKRAHSVKLLPDEQVNGAAAYVIEATPKKPDPQGPSRFKYYFDKDKGLLIKMVGFNPSGQEAMNMTVSDVKVNPKLDPARFTYKPEPGTNVIDTTRR